MSVDLTGGIDSARECVFTEAPADPEMRDSASFWVLDDQGRVGLPRIGIEAVAANWHAHGIQVNVAFPDGRVFRVRADAPSWSPFDERGRPMVLGAGPLGFRCIEPFLTWTLSFDGQAVQTSSQNLLDGITDGPLVDVRFDVEATMAVPPWVQGALDAQSRERLKSAVEGDLMGGPRYEQLFGARGSLQVGDDTHTFTGTGLRIRRQGVRRLAGFWGHCWQSALFPDGRAFGYIAYPPRADGQPTFNEGYVFDGDGELIPARAVQAPWLTRLQTVGEDVTVVLETPRGPVRIEGQTVLSTHDVHHSDTTFSSQAMQRERATEFPALQQAGVRYRWDGVESYGMLERSNPLESLVR